MDHKQPFVISIVGDGSNCGKTSLAQALVSHLRTLGSVGAVKIATATDDRLCARTGRACHCLRFDGDHQLRHDPKVIGRPGKDTQRLIDAGAVPVWWLQTTRGRAIDAAHETKPELIGTEYLVVEGSAFARAGLSDRLIAVQRIDRDPKEGFAEMAAQADLVLSSRDHGPFGFDPDHATIAADWLSVLLPTTA